VLPVWQNLLLGANCQVLLSTECVDWSSYLALEIFHSSSCNCKGASPTASAFRAMSSFSD